MKEPLSQEDVQSYIYRIRGQQVMMDAELASLYGVGTKVLVQAVKRNLDRFPSDFMFRLTSQELKILRSQIVTSSWGGRRYLPYVFTEEGVAMLSSILRGRRAALVNVAIMRAFVKLRHAVLAHQGIARRVERLEGKVDMHETDIRLLVQDVSKLTKRPGPDGPINPSIL
jgi:hypothetical protein